MEYEDWLSELDSVLEESGLNETINKFTNILMVNSKFESLLQGSKSISNSLSKLVSERK